MELSLADQDPGLQRGDNSLPDAGEKQVWIKARNFKKHPYVMHDWDYPVSIRRVLFRLRKIPYYMII
ncbi:hypothetical protein PaelaDRAFT_0751 [Paenibacillus lactis 154]|uniref:Uncharacterized protein n=1 Tax=Paenibacillus lactis 154 TaxID=743719 RepID=G4H9U0_9BACL|nr:hypothetical protein PaelaDRAFT_0751 [Paenibacillus lactis 154]